MYIKVDALYEASTLNFFAMKKTIQLFLAGIFIHFSLIAQTATGLQFSNVDELRSFLSYSRQKSPLVSAHRGGPSSGYPENAIETFEKTARGQRVIIETDIAISKDSVLVMMHDNRLDRTTNGTGLVSDFTLEELKKLYLKDNEGNLTTYRIPTLEEVLQWGKGKVIFTLDPKRGVPYKRIINTVNKHNAGAYAVIITYNANQAAEVHQLDSNLVLSVSIRNEEDLNRLKSYGIPEKNMVAFVGTSAPDTSLYSLLHSKGISCILGTMGNIDRQAAARGERVYRDLVIQGASILSTDYPEAVWRAFAELRNTSPARTANLPDTVQKVNPSSRNSVKATQQPYVILISADGFRHDYIEKYDAKFLQQMVNKGVKAESMIPAFPTVTFPNHYTIATGLYPSHHGVVNNSMYNPADGDFYTMGNRSKVMDGKWYGGTPLWVLAEQQQMISANLFWVGSEAPVKNIQSTYWYPFNDRMDVGKRIQVVKDWLTLPEERRPHFITFYLSDVDHAGHRYGPDAPETHQSVKKVDSILQVLHETVAATGLSVNFVFVSDHGMTAVNRDNPIPIPSVIDTAKFVIPSTGTMTVIHAKDKKDIQPLYLELKKQEDRYKTYLKKDVPKELHYGEKDDRFNRIGDILLIPDWPYVFSNRTPGAGYHGFPSSVKDMHAIFVAWGPAFKEGVTLPSFENVHVYPLIAKILSLNITEKIDGKPAVLSGSLKK